MQRAQVVADIVELSQRLISITSAYLRRSFLYDWYIPTQPCPGGCSLAYFPLERGSAWLLPPHIPEKRREMKNRPSVSEVSAKLGYPSSETAQGLRLWKAFI